MANESTLYYLISSNVIKKLKGVITRADSVEPAFSQHAAVAPTTSKLLSGFIPTAILRLWFQSGCCSYDYALKYNQTFVLQILKMVYCPIITLCFVCPRPGCGIWSRANSVDTHEDIALETIALCREKCTVYFFMKFSSYKLRYYLFI